MHILHVDPSPRYTGWPIKTELHTSHNTLMQKVASVYEVTSPEKNDTKITNYGSVVRFLGHILGDNFEFQNLSLFSLN